MAMSSLRLRRAATTATSTIRLLSGAISPATSHCSSPYLQKPSSVQSIQRRSMEFVLLQSRAFRASPLSLSAGRGFGGGEEIGPDTILFEGCDYNHWLIVMDFPKENKPSPEEMVRTYEETCAKGLNISLEEAKLKMYACSTTTYTGFQAVMTEEESEKFNGLPGVIFVLPDSYIDPLNKEYGGDKYMNGTIIPRPPPIQYGRQTGRYRDQPKYDRPRGPPGQEVNPQFSHPGPNPKFGQPGPNPQFGQPGPNPQYGQQSPMPGGPPPNQQGPPSYGQQQRSPQNYPPPQQQPGGANPYQQGRGGPPPPQYQGNYNQGWSGNYNQGGQSQGPQGGFGQGPQGGFGQGPQGGFSQGPQGGYGQGPQGGFGQGGQGGFGQGGPGSYNPRDQSAYPQGGQRYGPPPTQQGGHREDFGNYGRGSGGEHQGQGGFGRN